jgi:hypothetical protein
MFFYFKPFEVYFEKRKKLYDIEITLLSFHIGEKFVWDLVYFNLSTQFDIFQLILFGFKIKGAV